MKYAITKDRVVVSEYPSRGAALDALKAIMETGKYEFHYWADCKRFGYDLLMDGKSIFSTDYP